MLDELRAYGAARRVGGWGYEECEAFDAMADLADALAGEVGRG